MMNCENALNELASKVLFLVPCLMHGPWRTGQISFDARLNEIIQDCLNDRGLILRGHQCESWFLIVNVF